MTSLQSIDISGFRSGVQKNKKPFLVMDDAFITLENAYCWREEVKKRDGLKFLGRFRRSFEEDSIGNSGASVWNINTLYTQYVTPITAEATAEIQPGSVVITIQAGPDIVFTDQGNGILTSPTPGNSGYIDYLTGNVFLTHTAGAGVPTVASFAYFPGLPAMGIHIREVAGINDEQTMWFDTKYCYIHNGSEFSEFLPATATTWDGTDSDFFWATNYRGSESQQRLFFVTNFALSGGLPSAGSPMRYTDSPSSATWTTFKPITGGLQKSEVLTTTLASGSAAFGPSALSNLPILEGSVVITVTHNAGTEDDIIFRDTPKDGTLVSSGSNTGTIVYSTGVINLTFNPVLPGSGNWTVTAVYAQEGSFLFTARILIPYYGRLLALNCWEGTSEATAVNIFNRCRFSQVGSPIQQDSWRSDVFGKGGFIDAPVNEEITGAQFYKNTLIVTFERSTWRLQYLGEYGLPFIWERISSDFGSESTFSSVLFDNGVLNVGDKAVSGSSGSDVQRIDLAIPDEVFQFNNDDGGPKRVHGVRDFKKELVFWCYNDYDLSLNDQYFPNKTLVYNYRNNTFAFFRNNVTCYGNFQYFDGISWDRTDIFWDQEDVFWDDDEQPNFPLIVSANQQGFAHFYGYPNTTGMQISNIIANDQESLSVTGVTVGATDVRLTIKNHNLVNHEIIYLTGLNYVVTATPAAGSTTLNDRIYQVSYVDVDTVIIRQWSDSDGIFVDFTPANTGTYVGGGMIALFPNIYLETKDFNPMNQVGQNIKTSYIDFLFDVSYPSPITVLMQMNTVDNDAGNSSGNRSRGNLLIGNQAVESANSKNGYISNITQPASPTVIVTSRNHGLLTGDRIAFANIGGSTELNNNQYTVTFLTTNTFSVSQAGISAYTFGGYWSQLDTETSPAYFTLQAQYSWHRFFATCFGQYLRLVLTYSPEQMAQISTHTQNFVLNAMKIWYRPGGKNIFGR